MKNNKGYTLVEVIVSFSLIMIVMIYLLKTIIVLSDKNNELLLNQEFLVYESSLLDKIYSDIDSAELSDNVSITNNNNEVTFNDIDKTIKFDAENSSIIYNNIIYKLPDTVQFDNNMYEISNFSNGYILKINLIKQEKNKTINIVYQSNK